MMMIKWLLFFASCSFHHDVGDYCDDYGDDGDDDVWHELNRG